jgi:hypothetical protein
VLPSHQKKPRELETPVNPELVRRRPEDGFELTDEVKGRNPNVSCDVGYRRRGFVDLTQQIPRFTQAPEESMTLTSTSARAVCTRDAEPEPAPKQRVFRVALVFAQHAFTHLCEVSE